jgi:hypothetical protein
MQTVLPMLVHFPLLWLERKRIICKKNKILFFLQLIKQCTPCLEFSSLDNADALTNQWVGGVERARPDNLFFCEDWEFG